MNLIDMCKQLIIYYLLIHPTKRAPQKNWKYDILWKNFAVLANIDWEFKCP